MQMYFNKYFVKIKQILQDLIFIQELFLKLNLFKDIFYFDQVI